MRRALLIAAATTAILHNAALAHSWYPPECCSGHDCRPVPCEALTENNIGFRFTTLGIQFTKEMTKVSQDHSCHVCYGEYKDGQGKIHYTPRCVYILPTA